MDTKCSCSHFIMEIFGMGNTNASMGTFAFENAKWFNHEWIKRLPVASYQLEVKKIFEEKGIIINDDKKLEKVIELVRDRCTLLTDFVQQAAFFFKAPAEIDLSSIKPKWDEKKNEFFMELVRGYEL